jgi:hypothetical protein
MKLSLLVSVALDAPWCGTKPFKWPRPHGGGGGGPPAEFLSAAANLPFGEGSIRTILHHVHGPGPGPQFDRFGAEPQPWAAAGVTSALFASIDLYLIGRQLSGSAGEAVGRAANTYFDEVCGSIPLSVLISILLHRKPDPQPWVERIRSAAALVELAEAVQAGEAGSQMATAAQRVLGDALAVLNASGAGAAAGETTATDARVAAATAGSARQ